MKEPIVMSLTCGTCGTSQIHNEDPEIGHPLDFLEVAKARGWTFPVSTAVQLANCCGPPKCPSCTAKGK